MDFQREWHLCVVVDHTHMEGVQKSGGSRWYSFSRKSSSTSNLILKPCHDELLLRQPLWWPWLWPWWFWWPGLWLWFQLWSWRLWWLWLWLLPSLFLWKILVIWILLKAFYIYNDLFPPSRIHHPGCLSSLLLCYWHEASSFIPPVIFLEVFSNKICQHSELCFIIFAYLNALFIHKFCIFD